MKYKSELIKEIVESRGHEKSSIHYESECVESWIEEAKGSYPKLCDYQSEWLNYINENPLGKFPYETVSNVTDATVNNVVPYAYKSAILSGCTLVNKEVNLNRVSGTNWTKTNNIYTLPAGMAGSVMGKMELEANTKYIVKYSCISTLTNIQSGNYVIKINTTGNDYDGNIVQQSPRIGENSFTFTTKDITDVYMSLYVIGYKADNDIKIGNFRVIKYQEGMENWNIPYFTGMQSVKMPVLTTTGKNLFDKTKITENYAFNGDKIVVEQGWFVSDYIPVRPNTDYKITKTSRVHIFDKNKKLIEYPKPTDGIFTTPTNASFIRINGQLTDLDKWQVEEGSTTTSYEPYKSIILTVNEDVELRGVGDVKDELNLLTGEVTERIREVVLDGSENWESHAVKTDTMVFKLYVNTLKQIDHHIISDRFPTNAPGDVEKITNTGNTIYIAILKSKADNLKNFKSYLSQNPMTVQYQLATESVKTVELTVIDQEGNTLSRIKPIEGTMHLSTSGSPIKPLFNGEIPVEATSQNLASFIGE